MRTVLDAPRHRLESIALEVGYKAIEVNRMSTRQLRYVALYEADNDRNAWDNFDGDCVDDYETNE